MLQFKDLIFTTENNTVKLKDLNCFSKLDSGFVQVQIAGENKNTHLGAKMVRSSEAGRLCYKSHTISGNTLTVVQESPNVRCETVLEGYDDTNAIRIHTVVTNITDEPIVLEEVSAFCVSGIGDKNEPDNMQFTNFLQSHHVECQPRTQNFRELGLYGVAGESQQRVCGCNIGSWSTKEMLPMGAKLMTLECGMRFLADYLNGDKYFKVHRKGHNLDRARTQFELVRHMEAHWDEMTAIIEKI